MKTRPCYECPERVIIPNCHMTCERYAIFRSNIEKQKEHMAALKKKQGEKVWTNGRFHFF